jgi:hypothetical protein
MEMTKTALAGPRASNVRRLCDPERRRALLRAMTAALGRSVVLLPLDEDEDLLQDYVERALGLSA